MVNDGKQTGIDTRINYVTNGNINTYPLGFTIPLGYNQSEIIFTWQNLGTTNVNYSISLVIGNIQAVERPLINITRSGLIPRHEQGEYPTSLTLVGPQTVSGLNSMHLSRKNHL